VDNPDIYVTRSGRRSRPPERLIYDANSCLIRSNEHEDKEALSEQGLLAYKASTDPDTIYHHQAMKQLDMEKFQEATRKECEKTIHKEISKYKARMSVDGSQMIKGLHYEETYAPVVQWATIRFFISLAILSN
jgi:hypothetical protein